jgi:hypothetical protein
MAARRLVVLFFGPFGEAARSGREFLDQQTDSTGGGSGASVPEGFKVRRKARRQMDDQRGREDAPWGG